MLGVLQTPSVLWLRTKLAMEGKGPDQVDDPKTHVELTPRLMRGCQAFTEAIGVLGRPWTGLILGLLQAGSLRFGELEARAKGVGAKTLSTRLKSLEKRGIVARRIDAGPPIRVHYALTRKGSRLQSRCASDRALGPRSDRGSWIGTCGRDKKARPALNREAFL